VSLDDRLILPRHLTLCDIYLWGYTSTGFTFIGHTSIKLQKSKLLTGLTCVLKKKSKFAQKQNLEVKQIFVYTLLQQHYEDFVKIATF
jgi:hypothetical protein